MANGQFEKLKNHSVGELEQAAQDKYINRIVNLMGLFNEMTNQDFKSTFAFKGKGGKATKSRMPLVSNSGTTGILNHYINWGYFSDSTYSISVHPITNDLGEKTSDLEVVINHEGVKIKLPLSELTDERGKSRRNGDPAITQLTDFLKTKYMNVNKKDINNPKNLKFFGLPTGWAKATPTSPPLLTYDKYDSYNDYVLENSLYSDVLKTDESTDEIPTFVNQYITFDEETTPTLPELVIEEEEVTPEKNNAVENADISEEVVEEAVEYADGYYLVDIDNGTIKDAETEKIIDPTSKTGKTVMKKAIAGKETVGTVVDNALAGFTAGPDAGGSTFNNVFKKTAPVTETAENVEAKDKTLCPTAPKGGKKKINRKR
jgi:hypothetical protein